MRNFGRGRHGGIPVKKAAATIAGEQFALAKLVPDLGPDAHAATGALLVVGSGDAGAARAGEAVEVGQPVGLDFGTKGFAAGVERRKLGG